MRTKRLAVFVSGVSVALLLSVPAVHADAAQNENNCLGWAFSGLVPAETAGDPPTYGEVTRAMAHDRERDDALTGATGTLASCG